MYARFDWPPGLEDLQREMERFLDHVARQKGRSIVFQPAAWQPRVDLYETPASVVVVVELPGIAPEQIEVIVDRGTLLVRGVREERALPGCARGDLKQAYHMMEIHFGPFERIIHLPLPVAPDRAEAEYQLGFLEIRLPKAQASHAARVTIRPTAAPR